MHRNARLTPAGRRLLCERIEAGWPVAHAAAAMGISRDRAYVWWRRYQDEGLAGLEDRSSRPQRCPNQTRPALERRIVTLRQNRGLGAARIAGILGQPASTVQRVLVRHGLNRLDCLDRATRVPIRRIEMSRPGELVHVDIKKLGKIPKGGGWRAHGRAARTLPNGQAGRPKVGYAYIHSAIDGYSRLAYSEVLTNEQGVTRRASGGGRSGSSMTTASTSNGCSAITARCYRSREFATALGAVTHTFTRPYRPATNGKAERFNRTLLIEWAYVRPWASEGQRTRGLARWLHIYNHHRYHTAIGGPPVSRVSNLAGSYS